MEESKPYVGGIAIGNADPVKCELARRLRREMTPAERELWHCLRANRFEGIPFRRQVAIRGFIVDFYCPRHRLAIEVDGSVHNAQRDYDRERSEILGYLGINVIRFSNDQVLTNIASVKAEIKAACSDPLPADGDGMR